MVAHNLAQEGYKKICSAILEYLATSPDGHTNIEIVNALGLQSSFFGKYRNYLTWSILGNLLEAGQVQTTGAGRNRKFSIKHSELH